MAGSDEGRCAAFVVNHDARYRAYVNRCSHVGTPLDLWPNQLFTDDGPCIGDRLTALPLTRDGDMIVVRFPVER